MAGILEENVPPLEGFFFLLLCFMDINTDFSLQDIDNQIGLCMYRKRIVFYTSTKLYKSILDSLKNKIRFLNFPYFSIIILVFSFIKKNRKCLTFLNI